MTTETTEKCIACNKEMADNRVTKTTDKKYVCLDCYRNTCSDLGKSTITGTEAKATKKFLRSYAKQCNKYMLAVQVHAQQRKVSPRKAMQEFVAIEQHVSKIHFKKDWTCTSPREHYEAMEAVLASLGYAELQKGDVIAEQADNKSQDHITATRAWYYRRREHGRSLLFDVSMPVFPPRIELAT